MTGSERLEEDATLAAEGVVGAARALEIAAIVLIGLLVCPPLAIVAVLVVIPLLITALALGLLAAILGVPYLIVQHLRGQPGGHLSLFAHRLRTAGRAVVDLAPHRIHAAARKRNAAP
jgi:hypothetical protein